MATMIWTFSTNRNWGERTNDAVIMNPITGEPQMETDSFTGTPTFPSSRGLGTARRELVEQ